MNKLEIKLLDIEANSPSRKVSLMPSSIIKSEVNNELNEVEKLFCSLPEDKELFSKQFL